MILPGIVKLPHPKEIPAREAPEAGMGPRKVGRELVDDALAPIRRLDLPADDGADLPIEIDQGGVDGLDRPQLGGRDQLCDLDEPRSTDGLRLMRSGRRSSPRYGR